VGRDLQWVIVPSSFTNIQPILGLVVVLFVSVIVIVEFMKGERKIEEGKLVVRFFFALKALNY